MALRKPLVIIDGVIQQLPPSDTLNAQVQEVDVVILKNGNSTSALSAGQIVYASGDNTCDLAKADAIGTARPIGFVKDNSIPTSATGAIQTDGVLSLTDWTAATGSTTLTPGSVYYLSNSTAGKITSTPPTSGYVVEVGIALSSTELDIDIKPPIGLT